MSVTRSAPFLALVRVAAVGALLLSVGGITASHAQDVARKKPKPILLPDRLVGDLIATFDSKGTVSRNGVTATRNFHSEVYIRNAVFTLNGAQGKSAKYDLTSADTTVTGQNVLTQTTAGTGCTSTQTTDESLASVTQPINASVLLDPKKKSCSASFGINEHLHEHLVTECGNGPSSSDHDEDFVIPIPLVGKTTHKGSSYTLNFNGIHKSVDQGFPSTTIVTFTASGEAR
jgi:hypothetical protein